MCIYLNMFPLLPTLMLTCYRPSLISPFSEPVAIIFPSNKPHNDLPNSFPMMASLHLCTHISGVVAHILECMEGWNLLARLTSRLNLDSIDFCPYWCRPWLRSAYTFNTIINIDCILFSASQWQRKGGTRIAHPHHTPPGPTSTTQCSLLQWQVSLIINNIYYIGAGCLILYWACGIFRKYLPVSPSFFSLRLTVLQF